MKPALPKSYKGRFPFRLGTTSYIYPRGYIANIEQLGPWLDEIELLLFESQPASWPSPAEISQMVDLAEELAFRYHIHLPLDLPLGHALAHIRHAAVETALRLCELTSPLSPTTLTLHLPLDADRSAKGAIDGWRQRIRESLVQLISSGVPPHLVSLENLEYPIEWINEISQQTGFRMCLDVGHLLVQNLDVSAAYRRYREKIDVIHLHGVRNGKDHLSLDAFGSQDSAWIPELLETFTGSLSLEVFSYESLITSLDFFERLWEKTHEWKGTSTQPAVPGEDNSLK